ncbi:MAG TPA: hypothetical protein ENH90_01770 [bacterium]|nr:hypothetical protein [bacterium]
MNLAFLERKGTIRLILAFFNKNPQRFRDLKKTLPREATLSIRIRDLEELKLIESFPVKEGRRKYFAYKLTNKGEQIAKQIKNLESLTKE